MRKRLILTVAAFAAVFAAFGVAHANPGGIPLYYDSGGPPQVERSSNYVDGGVSAYWATLDFGTGTGASVYAIVGNFGTLTAGSVATPSANIDGGTIDGTAIGGSDQAAGKFKTLSSHIDTGATVFQVDPANSHVSGYAKRQWIYPNAGAGVTVAGEYKAGVTVWAIYGNGDIMWCKDDGTVGSYWDASAGSVGIGTAAPLADTDIHVKSGNNPASMIIQQTASGLPAFMRFYTPETGQTWATDGFYVGLNENDYAAIVVAENTFLGISTNNTERMRITADGNVGVATTNLSAPYRMQVQGSSTVGGVSFYGVGQQIASHAVAGQTVYSVMSPTGVTLFNIDGNGQVYMLGNVGINTEPLVNAGPYTMKFSVLGTGSGAYANIRDNENSIYHGGSLVLSKIKGTGAVDNTTQVGQISFEGYDGSAYKVGAFMNAVVDGAVAAGNVPMTLRLVTGNGTTWNDGINLTSSGNVGVGLTNPTARVDIKGAGATSATTGFNVSNSSGLTSFTVYDDRSAVFGGNVGIKNSNPGDYDAAAYHLVVGQTDGSYGITILTATNGVGQLLFADGTGAAAYRGRVGYDHALDALYLRTAGSDAAMINSNGNLGVGATDLSTGAAKAMEFGSGTTPTLVKNPGLINLIVAGVSVMNTYDITGTITQISSHRPGTGEKYHREFNIYTGEGYEEYASGTSKVFTVEKNNPYALLKAEHETAWKSAWKKANTTKVEVTKAEALEYAVVQEAISGETTYAINQETGEVVTTSTAKPAKSAWRVKAGYELDGGKFYRLSVPSDESADLAADGGFTFDPKWLEQVLPVTVKKAWDTYRVSELGLMSAK